MDFLVIDYSVAYTVLRSTKKNQAPVMDAFK